MPVIGKPTNLPGHPYPGYRTRIRAPHKLNQYRVHFKGNPLEDPKPSRENRWGRNRQANNVAFLQLDLTDPELRSHAVTQSRALRPGIAALLTEAVGTGRIASVTSPEVLADDLYATYCGAMLTWAIDGSGERADWLGRHLDRALAPHRTQATTEDTPDDPRRCRHA